MSLFDMDTIITPYLPTTFKAYIDTNDFHYNLAGQNIDFHLSILLNGQSDQPVHELVELHSLNDGNYVDKLYYSYDKGVVGVELTSGSIWSLVK